MSGDRPDEGMAKAEQLCNDTPTTPKDIHNHNSKPCTFTNLHSIIHNSWVASRKANTAHYYVALFFFYMLVENTIDPSYAIILTKTQIKFVVYKSSEGDMRYRSDLIFGVDDRRNCLDLVNVFILR